MCQRGVVIERVARDDDPRAGSAFRRRVVVVNPVGERVRHVEHRDLAGVGVPRIGGDRQL
jgi:hypothetical protein